MCVCVDGKISGQFAKKHKQATPRFACAVTEYRNFLKVWNTTYQWTRKLHQNKVQGFHKGYPKQVSASSWTQSAEAPHFHEEDYCCNCSGVMPEWTSMSSKMWRRASWWWLTECNQFQARVEACCWWSPLRCRRTNREGPSWVAHFQTPHSLAWTRWWVTRGATKRMGGRTKAGGCLSEALLIPLRDPCCSCRTDHGSTAKIVWVLL